MKSIHPRGLDLLHDPEWNQGTAFTEEEREALGLRGLLPPRVQTPGQQVERVMENLRAKANTLEQYVYLIGLQDRNETLFYKLLLSHLEELMPIVYTPTVGRACERFGHIFRRPRGLYVSLRERGRIADTLRNWPRREVRVIVVTDGERILGLGDLGASGMGIPIGKLDLYVACAGIHPKHCLPITLDVGTNNASNLADPLYLGVQQERLRGPEYDGFIEEFVTAVQEVFPGVLLQFEDFGNVNAFRLIERYRDRICCFNDDIQGTAAVALAGLYSALRITGGRLQDQRLLFLGAGEAATGIGELTASALAGNAGGLEAGRQHCWFVDSKGLVVASREDLPPHKRPFAQEHPPVSGLLEAVRVLKPTVLVGASGQPGAFDQAVIGAMAEVNERPILFALSNPTSKSECTAEQAYRWSDGRAVFASGSPFDPVTYSGSTFVPGQGNNAYVFPGIGLGVTAIGARRVTGAMFLAAARALAAQVTEADLEQGRIYPSLTRIREVSLAIAESVARCAIDEGLGGVEVGENLRGFLRAAMYQPEYPELR